MGVRVARYLAGCVALGAATGCGPAAGDVRRPPEDSGIEAHDTDVRDTDVADTDVPDGPCPDGMVAVEGAFCIDAWEGRLEEWDGGAWVPASPYLTVDGRTVRAAVPAPDEVPQGYISGREAADACAEAGKHLCSTDEWLAACEGPSGSTWPYGDTYEEGACNDVYEGGHPVIDYFGTDDVWDMEHMNDPGINQQPNTVARGGEFAACISDWGAYDLHGNLHEWVDDPDGTFRGGFYADAEINGPGCTYRTTAHELGYHDYSTGFRCCAEISP